MAAPVANFQITPTLLVVKFTDISTGTPTSWLWDFGDSTTSTSQNPTKTYSAAGKYVVKLTATNSSGSSSLQRELVVDVKPILPVSLKTFVTIKLPSSLSVDEETKEAYIAQWQLYIQPLVLPEISSSAVFDETAYPPLANALIAMLSAYSIISSVSSKGMSASMGGGSGGPVKKITTGPSEVEFQSQDNARNLVALMEQLKNELCTMASRLSIKLPMCPPLPDIKFVDLKATSRFHSIRVRNIHGLGGTNPWSSYPSYLQITC